MDWTSPMATKKTLLQNLNRFDRIVNTDDGTPTDFFMRILQGSTGVTNDLQKAVTALDAFEIDTTDPIEGGPVKLADVAGKIVITHKDSGVTAGAKGTAKKVAVVTVDVKGHVTALTEVDIDFTVEVEDEGVSLGHFEKVNFAGAGVTATDAGGGVALVTMAHGARA